MKFFRKHFPQNTVSLLNLSKEVIIALIIVIAPTIYPKTANAGLFSYIFDATSDTASAKTLDTQDTPNSQNMPILKATVINKSSATNEPVLASGNALLAEVGPSGTVSDIEDSINTQISIYTVRSGDSLSQIAKMFDVSVNTIVWANNLGKNATLSEGQTLVILPISGVKHVVKKGETLKGIVNRYKADLKEVLDFNNLTISSDLSIGDTIIIPDAEPAESPLDRVKPAISNGPTYANYYMRPIVGGRKSQGIHGKNGVDLAAPVGTPIYASASGTVIASITNGGWNGGYGNYVIISHPNGTQTLYAHNSTNLVSVGQYVQKGDAIGKIGMTGKTTGPHVHFEIRGAKNPF